MNELQVTENTKAEGFGASLGINEERAEIIINHLSKVTASAFENEVTIAKFLVNATSIAQNPNELAFISFSAGAHYQSLEQENPLIKLFQALKSK